MVLSFGILTVLAGCGASRAAVPPSDRPTPVPEASSVPTKGKREPKPNAIQKLWSFSYAVGSYRYEIITEAAIAQLPDTQTFRSIPAITQSVMIAMTDSGITVIDPPPPTSFKCDSATSLFSRAQQLLPAIPAQLSAGTIWKDSITWDGCRGVIRTTSTMVREFTVMGDTIFEQRSAVVIQRTERITAKGEGNEGPHRILLSASGSGSTNLYLNTETGQLLGSSGGQTTIVDITTSGRTAQFLQRIKEQIRLR